MSPLVLNAFHVPLVNYCYNPLALSLINSLEQLSILIIDENSLQLWEVLLHGFNVPRVSVEPTS